jgi:hypothetical protein
MGVYVYSNELFENNNLIFDNNFYSKFSDPYLAIQVPNGVTLDESDIKLRIQFYVAPANMSYDEVYENLGLPDNTDFQWIRDNCELKKYEFSVDNTQTERILSVLNILNKPEDGYHWEIMKFVYC